MTEFGIADRKETVNQQPLTHEAKRYCKGDAAWTDWQPCTEEQAERYSRDETFKVRQRVCPKPAPHKQPPRHA